MKKNETSMIFQLVPSRYLGAVFDVESLVEKLLHQLASKQTILVNAYDTTNISHPISMYGSNGSDEDLPHVSTLNFGDPFRKHEMHCRSVSLLHSTDFRSCLNFWAVTLSSNNLIPSNN